MINYICKFYKTVMSLTPEALLSITARKQCIERLSALPELLKDEKQKRHAAVLIPLCVVDGDVCLLFTLRSTNLPTHSGQVSFPGGKVDDKDESIYWTALRETEEEIGIPPQDIDIWTQICRVQGNSGIVITPVVGELKDFNVKKLKPNAGEVAEIFTVSMKDFCNKENHACFKFNDMYLPVFICGKHKVWGITGMITHLFLQCFLPSNVYEADFLRKEYQLGELMPAKL